MDRRDFLKTTAAIGAQPKAILPKKRGKRMRLNFLMAGQSNMCDRGWPNELPTFAHRPRIFIYQRPQPGGERGTWICATETDHVDPSGGQPEQVGALGLAFANRMCELLPDVEIGLVARSIPGSVMSQWRKWNRINGLYGVFMEHSWWALEDSPVPAKHAGLLFWQGEGDTSVKVDAESWSERFSHFVSDARVDIQNLNLPVAFVRLGEEALAKYTYWGTLRTQQNWVTMKNVKRVDIDDLPSLSDGVHYPTSSYVSIGVRTADAMAAML